MIGKDLDIVAFLGSDAHQTQVTHVELSDGSIVTVDEVTPEQWRRAGFVPPNFNPTKH